jgi:hypothetical protein
MVLTLTQPQFDVLMSAIDSHYQDLSGNAANGDPDASRQAATLNRAADRLQIAWQRAVDGF